MILRELFKNALLDPFLIRGWLDWFLSFYIHLRFSILIGIIILLIIYTFSLRILSRKFKFLNSQKENISDLIANIRKNKQKFKPFIVTIKYMVIGLIITGFSWTIIAIIFSAAQNQNENNLKNYLSSEYTTINQENINQGLMLTADTISQHKDYLGTILGSLALYMLLLILLGTFFYTFSFGNKLIRNIAISIWILTMLLFLIAKLLDYYVIFN